MKMLKLLGAALAAVTMTFTAQAAKTAKAVVADSGKTLKFVYDETNYGTKGTDWFSVAEAEAIDPQTDDVPWVSYGGRVTKVIFDPSFAGYRPTQCGSWFYGFSSLATIEGIKNLDTSEAANFAYMFDYCLTLTALDLSGFDTAKATDMHFMFADSKNLKTISVSDRFVTTKVADSSNMFRGCTSLKGGNGTAYDSTKTDKTYARIDKAGAPGYFTPPPLVAKVVVEDGGKTLRFVYDNKNYGTKDTDWFSVAEAEAMVGYYDIAPWNSCRSSVTKVVFDSTFAAYRPQSCRTWFYTFTKLTAIEGIKNLDTSVATIFEFMFSACSSLTSLDVSGFDTAKVTNMNCMFRNCSSLTSLDLTSFDTANVTGMDCMFDNCSSLTTLDVSGFDTSKVTDMYSMFRGCSSLTTLDVTGFDTANVTDMDSMFDGCSSLTTLDLASFDTPNVTDMAFMFYGCSSLEAICASDRFVTDQVSYSSSMFQSCSKLVGGAGTVYDSTKTDKIYARIDGKDGLPGYFTPAIPTLFDSFAPGALNPKGATYNGFLGDETLGGTFTLVVKKPKKGSTAGAATLTKVDPATGKKVKITGTVDVATGVCADGLAGLELNAQGVGGSLGGVPAQGAVDAAKAKDQDALAVMDGFNKQVYGLVFADAAGEEAYLTATFSTKGKVKVAGSYRGAKVSGSSTMSVGDAVCAVSFVWSKKGVRVSFVLWFDKATRTLVDVSGLGAGAALVDAGLAGGSAATYPFALDEAAVRASVPDAITETFLPLAIRFDGKKFDAGKAAKVAYKNGELTVDTSKGDNVTGLKLSYSKGVLKGSFTVYAVTGGKLVKNKFTVAGVMVNGVGYAAGTSRKLPAIPFVLVK